MKKLLYIVFLLFPLQLVFAQTSVQDMQISLAREIAQQLNSDSNPNNNVAMPTTLEEATEVIAAAPSAIVIAALSSVTNGQPPQTAVALAAFASIYNSGVSPAAAATAASIPANAVTTVVTATLTKLVTDARGAGQIPSGGLPSVEDVIFAYLNDPQFNINEVFPDTSQADINNAIIAYIAAHPNLLTSQQSQQLANLGITASGPAVP